MSNIQGDQKKKYNLFTTVTIVISTMIGTGVFTSLGFQVIDIQSVPPILVLWILGGVIAICGSFVYGELASTFPKSGGEYNFLSQLYSPILGFLSGYTSGTVGFAAPVALAAMGLGSYMINVIPLDVNITPESKENVRLIIAVSAVILMTTVHLLNVKLSGNFQRYITSLVVILITGLVIAAFTMGTPVEMSFEGFSADLSHLTSTAFAVSLIYVSYSYSGWNGAAYIIEDIKNPQRNVPLGLFFGTAIVMVLYILVNFAFLYTVPINELAGQIDIGFLAAKNIFGTSGGVIISVLISICLLSAISGMTLIGPRVTQAIINTITPNVYKHTKALQKEVPVIPILFQSAVAIFLIVTYTFEQVLVYIGFTLSLFTALTVAGIFIVRTKYKHLPKKYYTPLYPVAPILFIIFEIWMLSHLLIERPAESLSGLATVLSGIPVFYYLKSLDKKYSLKD
ncbi:MAG: amino acid permease [Ignavibacteriaceae bacterium]|nr:amino acid permease [Ignavibacteriaceae bacterium]